MNDAEIIQRAKETFVLETPTVRLARELIGVAERVLAICLITGCAFTTWATCEPPPREESPYKPLNLKQPAEYRPLVSMTRSKP